MGKYNRASRARTLKKLTAQVEAKPPVKNQVDQITITTSSLQLAPQAKAIIQAKKVKKGIELHIGVDAATPANTVIAKKEGDKVVIVTPTKKTPPPQTEPRYMAWSIEGLWNQSIGRKDRPIEPRSHLYASELGKAPIDLFLSLKGVQPSNPPNARSTRKFEAGDIWEWILELVLRRAGLLISSQDHIKRCYPGMLEVTGRLDKLAGGKPDWEKAKHEIEIDFLPDFIKSKAETIITELGKTYGLGLKEIVVEIKSSSSFMFDVYERSGRASDNHELQAWHYLKNHDEAHIFYVCRDDVRVLELPVFSDDARIEAMYKNHIETITGYWKADQQPPLEKEIAFDSLLLKFKDNWRIKYSNYLTMLYGYQNQREYEDRFRPMAARFNRVIRRIAEGKTMTKNNLDALKEAKVYYPEFEKHIDEIKKHKEEILAEPEVIENGTE